jgi:short-subunit dehydrogenase
MPANPPPFLNNVVVLTGASSGIGRALAIQLAAQGARLSLTARDPARLAVTAAECQALGAETLTVPTNVSQEASCHQFIERTLQAYGRIDTLVNNAGITMWARFDEMQTLVPLEQIMQVNYLGSVYCTYYALPHLKQTGGRLVAVASLSGKTGVPLRSGYAASKHAMLGFFDSLRIELEGSGVTVTVICPDFVATGSHGRAFGADGKPLGKNPLQVTQMMSPETCAQIVLQAAAQRQREKIIGLRGKIGLWVKLVAPGLIDRVALRAISPGK